MKQCTKCREIKDLKDFSFKNKQKNLLQSQCKKCSRENNKIHYKGNVKYYCDRNKRVRKEVFLYVKNLKENSKCYKCGESDECCLDFHHRDPSIKRFSIGTGKVQNTLSTIKIELDKCDIICANCHRKLHRDLKLPT